MEMLEQCLQVNVLLPAKYEAVVLRIRGGKTYSLVHNWIAQEKPANKSFQKAVPIAQQHLSPSEQIPSLPQADPQLLQVNLRGPLHLSVLGREGTERNKVDQWKWFLVVSMRTHLPAPLFTGSAAERRRTLVVSLCCYPRLQRTWEKPSTQEAPESPGSYSKAGLIGAVFKGTTFKN